MKCASATAGIASVVTGLAVVLSSAPAHSTFLYLNQSQLISAAISASGVAKSSGEGATVLVDAQYGEDGARGDAGASADAEPANVPIMYAGIQQTADVYGYDDSSGYGARPAGGFGWWNPRSATRVDGVLPRHRGDAISTRPISNTPVATSPSKDSPNGSGSATPPAAASPSAPAANPPVSTPPAPSAGGSSPGPSTPITSPPAPEPPIVGLPSRSVPEPSTVGLLGMGLLLAFAGMSRGKRTRQKQLNAAEG